MNAVWKSSRFCNRRMNTNDCMQNSCFCLCISNLLWNLTMKTYWSERSTSLKTGENYGMENESGQLEAS